MSRDDGLPLQRSLPGRSYTSEAEFARERDRVLLPGWFCVGRADGLTEAGCYLAADVCGESILVTRTDGGGLAGHYNLCRHRGSRLVPQPTGREYPGPPAMGQPAADPTAADPPAGPVASGRFPGCIRCPYHAWTYALDGTLRAAPFLPGLREHRAALSLHPVDVATWGGFVFARLEPPSGGEPGDPLEAALGEIPARVASYPLAGLRTGARLRYDVAANWKVILENYNECYHCGPVHPELCELVPAFRRGGGDLDWEAGIPHRPGATTFTSTGTTRRAPFPGLSAGRADPALRRARAAQPDAQPVRGPCDRVHGMAPLRRADDRAVRLPLPPRRAGQAGLRPLRRGRLLGPGQPPGLGDLRAGPGRDGIAPVLRRLPGADGAAQRGHRPLRGGPAGPGLTWVPAGRIVCANRCYGSVFRTRSVTLAQFRRAAARAGRDRPVSRRHGQVRAP